MAGAKAPYRLVFYNEANQLFSLTGLWKPDNESSAVLQAKTGGKYVEDSVRELVRIVRAGESVRFNVFKVDARKDGSTDSSRARQDGPQGTGFSPDGMDMPPASSPPAQPPAAAPAAPAVPAVPAPPTPDDDIPF